MRAKAVVDAVILFSNCRPRRSLLHELNDNFAEKRHLASEDAIGYPYFTKIWNKYRPTIKPKSGGVFMKCQACTHFKETRFGAPGIIATKDPATRAAAKTGHVMHLKVRRSTICGTSVCVA